MSRMQLETITGSIGALIGIAFGNAYKTIPVLFIFMLIDIITGVINAVVNDASRYSTGLNSDALFKGAMRKVLKLILVIVGAQLDIVLKLDYCASAIACYLVAVEGVSILENLVVAGVPVPRFIADLLTVMQDQFDNWPNKGDNNHE